MKPQHLKTIAIGLQLLAALPLFVYPFVLIANLMGMAAPSQSNGIAEIAATVFMVGTTLYPVAFIGGLIMAWKALNKEQYPKGLWWSAFPLLYLAVTLAAMFVWGM